MPSASTAVTRSPSPIQPSAAAKIGVEVEITAVRRAPISTYARNVHRSPRVMPTRPDSVSQPHCAAVASVGSARPRSSQPAIASQPNAATTRIRLSDSEPMRRAAASKVSDDAVQQVAVPRAASSPPSAPTTIAAAQGGRWSHRSRLLPGFIVRRGGDRDPSPP